MVLLAAAMLLVGVLWTMQGLGYLSGSPMTGASTWAVIGPIVAGLGVALLFVVLRSSRNGRGDRN